MNGNLSIDTDAGFTFRLISGYRSWRNKQRITGNVASPIRLLDLNSRYSSKASSHELQIISPTDMLNDHLNFVGGVYYFDERYTLGDQFTFSPALCSGIISVAAPALLAPCLASAGSPVNDNDFNQRTKSFAVYGQMTLRANDQFDVVLGGRWTRDRKRGTLVQTQLSPAGAVFAAPENTALRFGAERPTWRINANWRPNRDILAYASFSTGFKSGGFNSGFSPVALGEQRIFDSEKVKNYELGLKTSWFDRAFTANISAFRMDIDGFQDRSFNGTIHTVQNAGSLRNQGIELDTNAEFIRGLRLNFSMLYLKSKFTDYRGAANLPGLPGAQDMTGRRPTFAPKFSGAFGAEYGADLNAEGWRWQIRSDAAFTSDANVGLSNDGNPDTIQQGYTLLNGRLSIIAPDDRWNFSIFGENLTNKQACGQLTPTFFTGPTGMLAPPHVGLRCYTIQPRTFGASLAFKF